MFWVRIRLGGREYLGVLNTGATISIVAKKTLPCGSLKNTMTTAAIRMGDGHVVHSCGDCEVKVPMGSRGSHTAAVCKALSAALSAALVGMTCRETNVLPCSPLRDSSLLPAQGFGNHSTFCYLVLLCWYFSASLHIDVP